MQGVATAPRVRTASILEIFESRQGEGPCVGDPHLFIRFGGCNLVCDYCDTPESIPARSGRSFSVESVLEQATEVERRGKNPVAALTGGEPLLQISFLRELIPALRARGWRIYLETNGSLPHALETVLKDCDWIAMDFKLESATGRDLWEAHRWFLEMGGRKIFVKMVLTDRSREAEFRRGVELVQAVRPPVPLILQPATPWGPVKSLPLETLSSWWAWASRRLPDVRIIPQIHRLWNIA